MLQQYYHGCRGGTDLGCTSKDIVGAYRLLTREIDCLGQGFLFCSRTQERPQHNVVLPHFSDYGVFSLLVLVLSYLRVVYIAPPIVNVQRGSQYTKWIARQVSSRLQQYVHNFSES